MKRTWINCNKRMPPHDIFVLAAITWEGVYDSIGLAKWNREEKEWYDVEGNIVVFDVPSCAISHWMNLPSPPSS